MGHGTLCHPRQHMSSQWQFTKEISSLLLHKLSLPPLSEQIAPVRPPDSRRRTSPATKTLHLLSLEICSSKCFQVITTRKLSPTLALRILPSLRPCLSAQTQQWGVLPSSITEEPRQSSSVGINASNRPALVVLQKHSGPLPPFSLCELSTKVTSVQLNCCSTLTTKHIDHRQHLTLRGA